MSSSRFQYLYQRYIDGLCTDEELKELKPLLHDSHNEEELHQLIDHTWNQLSPDDFEDLSEAKAQEAYQHIIDQPRYHSTQRYLWLKIAAVVMLVLSVSLVLFVYRKPSNNNLTAQNVQPHTPEIAPGGNKAILTLANGHKVVLDNAHNGQIAKQAGAVVNKVKDGQLVYASATDNQSAQKVQLNTISIPRGGQYDLVLADGTHVYLNSASSLTYPTGFTGATREVSLTGEAYFEVAKNAAKPFKVNVNNQQQVEVLGTHFNISAYQDDQTIQTTLLEGSVKLHYRDKQTILKPGQIAVDELSTASLTVKPADTDDVMAWRNGMFAFSNENIISLMKRISRWYAIDVVFKGDMKDINFVGNYSRNKSLGNLLKNIESTERVHFLTEGRRVTVIAQ